jgi:phytoene synthase
MTAKSLQHAAEFLREQDRDRYLAALVVRPGPREAIQALGAFNADVASIRDRAREPAPGEIRLKWWDDALAGREHGTVRQNPIADAFLETVDRFRLPREALRRLIAARRFDLYDDPMPDVETFEGYAGETASVLYQLAAMILNDGREVDNGDAAGHLGVAHALIGHLRAFGRNASRGQVFLPLSVFAANGVRESELFTGSATDSVRAAHMQLIDLARSHLDKAAAAIGGVPRSLRPAFAMISLLSSQLTLVERGNKEPFAPPRDLPDWRKITALAWWSLRQA